MTVRTPVPPALPGDRVALLETLCARSWPAAAVEQLGGWRLGFSGGASRRANSVLPLAWGGGDLDAAIAAAEARYRARGLTPCFKLTASSAPSGLDAALAARGWRVEGLSLTMTTAVGAVRGGPTGAGVDVTIAADPSPAWSAAAGWEPAADDPATVERIGIFERVPAPRAFALVRLDGSPAGTALGSIAQGWCCVSAVRTLPAFRRRGVARAAFAALAGWAAGQGAEGFHLQVEQDNAPAVALYQGTGFGTAYEYWYRTAPG